jgi:hypothetical protein
MHHYLGWISNLDLAFLCQYSNHAWGRRHHGWYITRGGELYSFKLDGGSYHTKKEGQIPSDELAEHQQLLEALASEPWEERHHMCDAGVYRVTGFLHRDDGGIAEYPLYSRGDTHGELASEEAQRILQWLKQRTPEGFNLWGFLDLDE